MGWLKRPFFITVLFGLCFSLYAGTTGKITGIIKDKSTGEPLIGVNVVVEGTNLGASTDADGTYIILNIPPGQYTLVASYIGYKDVKVSGVKVSVDFTTRTNIEMPPTSIELGETIEVVAKKEVIRKDLTASQAEITAKDIQKIPSEDFKDVLQLKAGITRDEFGGFHIRGGRSSEVAFWVDGVSVTDVFDGSNGVEIENSAIQSLQIISGTFNAEYGQAMSGIINIVTKEGKDHYGGEISAYTGDYFSNDSRIFLNITNHSPADLYNIRASLNGPIPLTGKKGRFFINVRNFYNEGWLYGQKGVNVDGTPGDSSIVPMNSNKWYTGQGNFTFQLTNLMKLKFTFSYENRHFRNYDHFFKFNPDGDFKKFRWAFSGSATLDHTLSSTTFYTLKFAKFENDFTQYVFQSPFDPRYVDNTKYNVAAFNFSKGGQKNQHFNRNTQTDIIKFDLTSQITKRHLIKVGLETRFHRLKFEDFNVIDGNQNDTLFTAVEPDKFDPNFTRYVFKPVQYSGYIQDKIEYNSLIVNIGLRFDYFNSRGRIPKDPKDPSFWKPTNLKFADLPSPLPVAKALELEKVWFKKPSAKVQLSPRVGVAYPITANGVIHFSYGHFLQIPEFRFLYQNPSFRFSELGPNNLMGNANLDAQRTVMYEIGLQQKFSSDIGVDLTGFYRDIRNWVGTSPLIETYNPGILYSQFENRDYANVRGITLSLHKNFSHHYSANFDYTFQVAEGNASNAEDAFNDLKAGREPRKTIIPLAWDRSNVINGNVYFGFGTFGMSILGRYETGLPYTPNPIAGSRVGASIQTGLRENSGRRPNLITVDLQIFKDFYLRTGGRKLKYSFFAKVFNLFDRRNEQGVFDDSGRATYTLQSALKGGGGADPRFVIRPDFYTEPRRIQFGMSLGF